MLFSYIFCLDDVSVCLSIKIPHLFTRLKRKENATIFKRFVVESVFFFLKIPTLYATFKCLGWEFWLLYFQFEIVLGSVGV